MLVMASGRGRSVWLILATLALLTMGAKPTAMQKAIDAHSLSCEALYTTLRKVGFGEFLIMRGGKYPAAVTSPELYPLLLEWATHGIRNSNPAIKEFGEIMNGAYASPVETKARLGRWRRFHRIPFRIAFKKYNRATDDNAALRYDDWNKFVNRNILPAADPHDLLSHGVALAIDGYAGILLRKARFSDQRLKPDYKADGRLETARDWIFRDLHGVVRSTTYENFSFIHHSFGKPHLVMYGNVANAFLGTCFGFLKGQTNTPAGVLLGPPSAQFDMLPHFAEYLEADPRPYRAMEQLRQVMGLASLAREEKYRKLATILDDIQDATDPTWPLARRNDYLADVLAAKIDADPQLKEIFNRENRLALMHRSVDFYEHYLGWLKQYVAAEKKSP